MDDVRATVGRLCSIVRGDEEVSAPDDVALNVMRSLCSRYRDDSALRTEIDAVCEAAHRLLVFEDAATSDSAQQESRTESRNQVHTALQLLFYAQQSVATLRVMGRLATESKHAFDTAQTPPSVTDEELVAGIARFALMDAGNTNKMQQLLLYLLNCAASKGYRRMLSVDGASMDCFERIFTPEGYNTCAWTRACSIKEFIYEVTQKELNFDMWLNLTSLRGNISGVIDHLSHCSDVQLPDLRKDRRVFSFSNGVYLAKEDRFVLYEGGSENATTTHTVSCKYFEQAFPSDHAADRAREWFDIPTPHLQSIMDFQDMSPDVCKWLYIMIGRLIYEVNELDGWQVIPFLKGAASSGKSTIVMRVCRGLYEANDVGVMSNNMERKFGLSAFANKLLFVGPEIKGDCAIEQAEFQSIVSGEVVQVAAKFKTAQAIEWRTPGILAGNEVPGWVDNSGSINRRIMLFDFPRRVEDGDMELGKKISRELPLILLKSNRAYLEAAKKYGNQNVWKHVPDAMIASKEEFTETVNSIVAFLRSGKVTYGEKLFVPLDKFDLAYANFVKNKGLKRIPLSGDKLKQPLYSAKCYTVKATLSYKGGKPTHQMYVKGADVVDEWEDGFGDVYDA